MFNLFNQINQNINPPVPIPPKPGQESVWDYPRPPKLEDTFKLIEIIFNQKIIVKTTKAKRVLETSHPPIYYIPPADIAMENLILAAGTSFCEWKGTAVYYNLQIDGKIIEKAAWSYPEPTMPFSEIKDYLAFYPIQYPHDPQNSQYPHEMDGCFVDGEKVTPQPGRFYGGWITSDIVGPFKGEIGSMGW